MEMLYMSRACSPIVRSVIILNQKHMYSVMREKTQLSDVYAYLCVCVCVCVCVCIVRVPASVRSTVAQAGIRTIHTHTHTHTHTNRRKHHSIVFFSLITEYLCFWFSIITLLTMGEHARDM
jgi:hypothetical protein